MHLAHLYGIGIEAAPWLNRVDQGRPWSNLQDQEQGVTTAFFRAATISFLGNGESTLFWTDNWIQGSSIRFLAPAVFEAVPKRKWSVTVAEAMHNHSWVHHVTGARTMGLLTDFIGLCRRLEQVQLSQGRLTPSLGGLLPLISTWLLRHTAPCSSADPRLWELG